MKEKMKQYGTKRSIRNMKIKYEKTQKESTAKRAMTDIKYDYLYEGCDAEIY